MPDFIVFSGPWKNHFVDHRGVLQSAPYGVPAHLAFIACREPRMGWAFISNRPIDPARLAKQLCSLNPEGEPAQVFASAALRKELARLLFKPWCFPAGGASPAGLLARFNSQLDTWVGHVGKADDRYTSQTLGHYPASTSKIGDVLWVQQFQLDVWNAELEVCPGLLLVPEGRQSDRFTSDLNDQMQMHQRLEERQRERPALSIPPAYRDPRQGTVELDGEENYPRSVKEALEEWRLGARTQAEVRQIPWPAVRAHIASRVVALEDHLSHDSARYLVAAVYGGLEMEQLIEALDLLEEYAVWYATWPPFKTMMEASFPREKAIRDNPLLNRMLGASLLPAQFYLTHEDWTQRYLCAHYPVRDIELASAGQLIFCANTMSLLDDHKGLDDELRQDCLEALLGLSQQDLLQVRKWRDADQQRKKNSWALKPDAEQAAARQLWSALGNAPKRWIRLEELSARLRGSEAWARSNAAQGGISPALLAQAAAGSDCRILLTGPEEVELGEGPMVRALVCTAPVARAVIQAGGGSRSISFPPGVKRAVQHDTGPLPTSNCVYFEFE